MPITAAASTGSTMTITDPQSRGSEPTRFETAERTKSGIKEASDVVALPGGRKLTVEYAEGQSPAARSRLQDFFGLARGPAIANGRVLLVLHLLAPNGRAQQVTQDLAGFWQRHYPNVRRELMRRYPRHPWPEDGATASPPPPSLHRKSGR